MKKAFEGAYHNILPKGSSPFIYVRYANPNTINYYLLNERSLQIDPRSVDVNVHPTKREVHFLNEDGVTEKIADAIQENLAKQNHSRTFEYQVIILRGTTSMWAFIDFFYAHRRC